MALMRKKNKKTSKQSKRGCIIVVRGTGGTEVRLNALMKKKTKSGKAKAVTPASHLFMTESEEQRIRTQKEFLERCASYRKQ